MPAQASTLSWKNVRHPCTSRHEKTGPYHLGLDKSAANYVALWSLSFLQRAAEVHPDRIEVIDGELDLGADLRPPPPSGQCAAKPWRDARRHGIDHAAQCPRNARSPLPP